MIESIPDGILLSRANERNTLQEAPAAVGKSFQEIAEAFWGDSENRTANDFLSTLTRSEMEVIQQEHHLAAPLANVNGLSTEVANNLLRAHGETVDENRDGIDTIGPANTWRFPNSNTPAEVEAAWNEATESLSEGDKMLMAGILFMPLPQIVQDPSSGRIVDVIHPGDPGYQDPSLRPTFSHYSEVELRLRALDDPSSPPVNLDFYKKAKAFYPALLDSFSRHQVA